MNKEDYNKLIEKLKKVVEKNKELINLYKEKINILQFSQFKYKCKTFSFFAVLGYALLFFIFLLSTSITYTPFIILIGSFLIGISGQKMLYKLCGVKSKLKEFSNAKNDKEKLKEVVVNAIELEKLQNKNESIDRTIQKLAENRDFLEQLSDIYKVSENPENSKETIEKRKENLTNLLKQNEKELENLCKQNVLNEQFWQIREKGNVFMQFIAKPAVGGAFAEAIILGVFIISSVVQGITLSAPMFFAPLVAGILGTEIYMIKRTTDEKKVFNKINSELKENALPKKVSSTIYDEQKQINEKINLNIIKSSDIRKQLHEINLLNNITKNEKITLDTNNNKLDIDYTIENNKELETGPTLKLRKNNK